jgi:hypothetical protein
VLALADEICIPWAEEGSELGEIEKIIKHGDRTQTSPV